MRINFLERPRFVLSYSRMIAAGGVVLTCGLLIFGAQWIRVSQMEGRLAHLNAEVTGLKENRDRLLKNLTVESIGGGEGRSALRHLMEQAIPWSTILKGLADPIPRSVWLTRLESDVPPAGSAPRQLQLEGEARDPVALTRYLARLGDDDTFGNVVLTSSKESNGPHGRTYHFMVNLSALPFKGGDP